MNPVDQDRVMDVLAEAVELPPERRATFLDSTCAGEAELRREVEELLACADPAATTFDAAAQHIVHPDPDRIGPYEILEPIGEGGMAVVYRARQHHPVRRTVALKLVKLGMDTRQFVARFESERQVLALMDHPNVARVYDAGSTDTGRPYFVMEHVAGLPLLDYCDAQRLGLRQRLELFVVVCDAVEHAHRKGIIHRDLKNSNVLVAEVDGRPAPKVIDFGVAKIIQQPLGERGLQTEHGQMIGTPEYMSPEQAERGGVDVDTRTDVYSLGVLLYELIAGVQPLASGALRCGSYEQVQQIIRETEPPRPSTRLSNVSPADAAEIAKQRRTALPTLLQNLRSELEWIPLKAMRKDREQRYRSSAELADDIRNYLDGRPLIAGPESSGYRTRKFLRRHKAAVAASAAMLLLLFGGIVATTWGLLRAGQQRQLAQAKEREAVQERDAKDLALKAEQRARADEAIARRQAFAALRSMTDEVVERKFAHGTALTGDDRAFLRGVIAQYDAFAAVKVDDADSRAVRAEGRLRVGKMRYRLGEFREAEQDFDQALRVYQRLGSDLPAQPQYSYELATCHNARGDLLRATGRLPEAEKDYDQALGILQGLAAGFPSRQEYRLDLARSHTNRAAVMYYTGRLKEMEKDLDQAVSLYEQLAADTPAQPKIRQELARNLNVRGDLRRDTGRLPEAGLDYDRALDLQRRLSAEVPTEPELHNELAISCVNLAFSHGQQRNWTAALPLLRESLPHHLAALKASPRHPTYRQAYRNHLNMLTKVHAGLLEPDDAVRTAEACRDLGWNAPEDVYNAACFLSQCVPIVAEHDKLDDQQRKQAVQFYGDEAMSLLREAVSKGYEDAARIKKDEDLDPLRQREDFQALVAKLAQ